MAEAGEYALTHAAPNNTELALLTAFIDQRIPHDLLRHRTRMFELLSQNGLIARSIFEQRFLARILSMYAQTMANKGLVGTDGELESASLEIRVGKLNGYPYVAIVSRASKLTVLRGQSRCTKNAAMESFIDTVLLLGKKFKKTVECQRDEYNLSEAERLEELKRK
ncbi:hypothetical protein CC86DRAFT_418258 [Ophiobolus disseminans]|uniref:Uncharacterized protein n=1 Tax=Ophiobolus disseminans TaxID=1469910 RepID=A0A6A6ZXF7_9PLEO|nr:hypothetical protein CC86DRAFT_418258 [Ophiobolus disseminans]